MPVTERPVSLSRPPPGWMGRVPAPRHVLWVGALVPKRPGLRAVKDNRPCLPVAFGGLRILRATVFRLMLSLRRLTAACAGSLR